MDYPHFDKLLSHPTRLGLMAHLVHAGGRDTFVNSRAALGLKFEADLSRHAGALERAKYLERQKSFVNNRPQTMLVLTRAGIKAFQQYKRAIDRLPSAMEVAS